MRVDRSFPSENALIDLLAKNYSLGRIEKCLLLKCIPNQVYKIVAEQGCFIFKIYNRAGINLELEVEYLNFLSEKGLHVARPIKTMQGSKILEISLPEGLRKSVLTEFASGNELAFDLSEHASMYGRVAAQLHAVSCEFEPMSVSNSICLPSLYDEAVNNLQVFFNKNDRINEWRELQDILAGVREISEKIPYASLAKSFLHADLHGGNAHLFGDKLTLFDFEYIGFGPIAYELAVFKWGTQIGGREWNWDHFVTGYQEIKNLSEFDLQYVQPLTLVRDILMLSYHISNAEILGQQYISKVYLKNRSKFLQNGLLNTQIQG